METMVEDPHFIDAMVHELKSQGLFDQFRKECLADVDTKPAYQNLRQRVDGTVSKFLAQQKWSDNIRHKNQLREKLRKNIIELGFLDTGVERIVDQVVNPKISTVFQPKVEEIVFNYLGIEKPKPSSINGDEEMADAPPVHSLPEDLEAVSPDSDKKSAKSSVASDDEERKDPDDLVLDDEMNESKENDDFESPAFEPLQIRPPSQTKEESDRSNTSIISGLTSQESVESEQHAKVAVQVEREESQPTEVKADTPEPPPAETIDAQPEAPPPEPEAKEKVAIVEEEEEGEESKEVTAEKVIVAEKGPDSSPEMVTNDSQLSQVSSNSRLSIITNSEENRFSNPCRLDITEDAQMPNFSYADEERKRQDDERKDEQDREKHNFNFTKDEYEFTGTERNNVTVLEDSENVSSSRKDDAGPSDSASGTLPAVAPLPLDEPSSQSEHSLKICEDTESDVRTSESRDASTPKPTDRPTVANTDSALEETPEKLTRDDSKQEMTLPNAATPTKAAAAGNESSSPSYSPTTDSDSKDRADALRGAGYHQHQQHHHHHRKDRKKSKRSSRDRRHSESGKKSRSHSKSGSSSSSHRGRSGDRSSSDGSDKGKSKPKASDGDGGHCSQYRKRHENRRSSDRDSNDGKGGGGRVTGSEPPSASIRGQGGNTAPQNEREERERSGNSTGGQHDVMPQYHSSSPTDFNGFENVPHEPQMDSSSSGIQSGDDLEHSPEPMRGPPVADPDKLMVLSVQPVVIDQMLTNSENLQLNLLLDCKELAGDETMKDMKRCLESSVAMKKPKYASNMSEARRLMKVRKRIGRCEQKEREKTLVLAKRLISSHKDIQERMGDDQGIELEFVCDRKRKSPPGPTISSPVEKVRPIELEPDLLHFPEPNEPYPDNESLLHFLRTKTNGHVFRKGFKIEHFRTKVYSLSGASQPSPNTDMKAVKTTASGRMKRKRTANPTPSVATDTGHGLSGNNL